MGVFVAEGTKIANKPFTLEFPEKFEKPDRIPEKFEKRVKIGRKIRKAR